MNFDECKKLLDYVDRVHAEHAAQRERDHSVMRDLLAFRSTATAIEALTLMRDTTQSQEQHDRAVEALKFYEGSKS